MNVLPITELLQVVPYTLRSLIVGTCAVIQSWDLRPDDVNSAYLAPRDCQTQNAHSSFVCQ